MKALSIFRHWGITIGKWNNEQISIDGAKAFIKIIQNPVEYLRWNFL